ncbi:glycoside hydrolase [Dichotomocladium elegans]|nr:glycoside hydrolase [Dichotomocladium elegans]
MIFSSIKRRTATTISIVLIFLLQCINTVGARTYNHDLTAYVVDWAIPSAIPWTMVDYINYAFAIPDKNGRLSGFQEGRLKSVVKEAHASNTGVSLSIGGWAGSINFSTLVRTDKSRQSFSDILVKACKEYDLDGIDIDWEYPNSPNGMSCNRKNPQDTANLLKFLLLLRKKLDAAFPQDRKWLSAAVATSVFNDENRKPTEILDPKWKSALDAAYDLNGYWAKQTASNSPLYGESSVDSAVKAWKKAGIPSSQLVVGVPFYGYTTRVTSAATSDRISVPIDHSKPQIQGDEFDTSSADPCPGCTPAYSGEMQWRSIAKQKIGLNAASDEWAEYWDNSTRTPYAYRASSSQFLTFDNPRSLESKVTYAKEQKLGGFMLWSLEMDDGKNTLLSALQGVRKK